MRATLLPDKRTPLTAIEALRAIRTGYRRAVGRDCTTATLAVHVAQSALETGRWNQIHHWNFGNVKAGPNYEGFYCQFRCNEIINGKVQWFTPPHPQTNFRAYASADSGAEAHMRFLYGLARYRLAWAAAEKGDPDGFVEALKAAGYFTANLDPYRRAVKSLFGEFMSMLQQMGPATEPAPPPEDEPEHSPMSEDDLFERLPFIHLEPDWSAMRAARDATVRGDDNG